MRSRLTILLTATLAAGLVAAGCGDDDDGTTTTAATGAPGATGEAATGGAGDLPADFLGEANGICKDALDEIEAQALEAFPSGGESSDAQQEQFVTEVLVPKRRALVEELRGLGEPEEGADEYTALLDDVEAATDQIEDDPSLFIDQAQVGDSPFAELNRRAQDLGLTECAG